MNTFSTILLSRAVLKGMMKRKCGMSCRRSSRVSNQFISAMQARLSMSLRSSESTVIQDNRFTAHRKLPSSVFIYGIDTNGLKPLKGFTKSLAKEVAPFSIRCNAIVPGFVDTDMTLGISPFLGSVSGN